MPGTAGRIISNLVNRTKGLDEIHDDVATLDGIVDVPAKDSTADVQMSDVVGKKDDTAVTTVATTKSIIAYTKGILNDLANATDGLGALKTLIDGTHDDLPKNASSETTGTYAHPSGVAEGTVKEITGTVRLDLKSIWIDLATLTQDATLKVYHKIDASTYRQYATYSWVTTDEDGVMIDGVTINNDWKVTITSVIAEGASRNIPYNIIYEPLE